MISPASVLIDDRSPARLAARRIGRVSTEEQLRYGRLLKLARTFTGSGLGVFLLPLEHAGAEAYFIVDRDEASVPAGELQRICLDCVHSGKRLVQAAAPEASDAPAESVGAASRSFVVIPLRSPDGFVVGAFGVVDLAPREWSPAQLELVEELALHAANEYSQYVARRGAEEALRQSHERLERVLGWSDCLLWEAEVRCNPQGWDWKFHINPSGLYHRLFGERVPRGDVGLWYKFNLPDQAAMDARSREAMLSGKDGYTQEFRVEVNGTWHWLRESVVIQRPSPESFRLVGVATDVSTLRELEASLAQARDQAIAASRAKSEFLANMSHEIRTPMNGVLGMASFLLSTELNGDQREMLQVIKSSGDALITILDDILDFSKIEAGKLRVEPVEISLEDLFWETLSLLHQRASEKGIELIGELHPTLTATVLADAGRIRQVLTNLVSNAIKFTQTGQVVVQLRHRPAAEGRLGITVDVIDTGIGLSAEMQSKLFQPFEQAEVGTTRRFGGTGLGLAISRRLVELMGGTIGCHSTQGVGSRFWFSLELPVASANAAPAAAPLSGQCLIVDRNPIMLSTVQSMVRETGMDARIAASAEDARRILATAKEDFSALIVDRFVPGSGGDVFVEELQRLPSAKHARLIVLAGRAPDAVDLARWSATVVNKPVRASTLRAALSRCSTQSPRAIAAPPPPLARPARSLRVLLADDNDINQFVGRVLIEGMGHSVDTVDRGTAVLTALEKSAYDLVLMDCQMPELDGYDATRMIRAGKAGARCREVPIVAVTAFAMAADRAKCLDAGMTDYVAKPLRLEDLAALFSRYCETLPRK